MTKFTIAAAATRRPVSWRSTLALFAALLLAVPAQAEDGKPFFTQIAPGVYVHHGLVEETTPDNRGDIANLGFIVGDESVAVIDSGGSVSVGEAALAALRRITDKPIAYLIDTHMHPDHVFGNQVFKAEGATIIGHERLAPALAARAESYAMSMAEQLGDEEIARVTITGPSEGVPVGEEKVIDLGGREIVLRAWETAHTDNDLTVFDRKTRTLFAGDLLFMEHIPVLDGSLLGWLGQTEALRAVDAERVVPGHGPVEAPWPGAIEPQTAYLEALARDVRAAIARGDRLQDTAETAGAKEAASFALADDYRRRNATSAFAELEWE
ncbi:quinoprotein relay system zinc metallohydrolase 2 [Fulvimarina endophytica]|uniref:Quinoprotein relay system zinc metallohydrolase 2 n=1 Tax=Fulvimarina endophytica TaxID=2293836 RepID=A0A371X021_9HYPH|nr:quinoprotein relay system zinc metallohydrolase 2 [Fulvimarina endophytica]RFC62591.1 quinoprotein relay system zinc metallohydrolase 2 [Fulvimarina endophytica]